MKNVHQGSLPTYAHMLALCLGESGRQRRGERECPTMDSLPFMLARTDAEGVITDATGRFLNTFGLSAVAPGMRADALLEQRLGISRASFHSLSGSAGRLLTVPEGRGSGTPVYLACM